MGSKKKAAKAKSTKKAAPSKARGPAGLRDRKAKPKQQVIPGTEAKVHKDISAAAEQFVEVRDARMALTEEETEANATLLAAMKKHGVTVYKDPDTGMVATIEGKEKVKVKRAKSEE